METNNKHKKQNGHKQTHDTKADKGKTLVTHKTNTEAK
jgi:hypothetical protein